VAYDGLQAVDVAEKFRPDLVLLDIGLPLKNGYDVCREIRRRTWGKDMVIVAVSGWGQEQDRLKSQEAGFDRHVVKPVSLEVLAELFA
jgi:DNA-binding response OmpR family regulator